MNIKDNLKLYCVYHKKELENNYVHTKDWFESYYKPLVETDWFKPYFTLDNHKNSLDKLQQIFCEVTAIYYIYKNNLYSPYIGICHYDRQLLRHQIETDDIANDIHFTGTFDNELIPKNYFQSVFLNFIQDDISEYVKTYYSEDSRIYNCYIKTIDLPIKWLNCINFICKWEYFDELAKFICGFIDWHNDKHNLNWDITKYKSYIYDNFVSLKDWKHLSGREWWLRGNQYRVYAYTFEMLIGMYFGQLNIEINGK